LRKTIELLQLAIAHWLAVIQEVALQNPKLDDALRDRLVNSPIQGKFANIVTLYDGDLNSTFSLLLKVTPYI